MDFCNIHEDHHTRIKRNEDDIQKLFDKFGDAIGLMYKVDKKMEALTGKIAGIAIAVAILSPVLMKLIDKIIK